MKSINLEQLLQLHAFVIQETGGSLGLRDLGRLESALATQTQHVFDKELYEDELTKAAALIRAIVADHPFVDGNKRTAMLVGLTFLDINNVSLKIPEGKLEDFAVKIAIEKLDVNDIAMWLESHLTT
jgi:death-on-curing protein